MTLPKLVRDLVPTHIIDDGRVPVVSIASTRDQHIELLRAKVNEEFQEFLDDPCLEEAGDCYEVLRALFELHGMTMGEVTAAADVKERKCGGFYEGIILEAVSEGGPIDVAIAGQEDAFEEEIDLHKTYGGD